MKRALAKEITLELKKLLRKYRDMEQMRKEIDDLTISAMTEVEVDKARTRILPPRTVREWDDEKLMALSKVEPLILACCTETRVWQAVEIELKE